MINRSLLIAATAISFMVQPALAQTKTTQTETNGHHYNGGPRSENHHMGKKDVGPVINPRSGPSGSHHYNGGPREPHHIGPR